MEKEQINLKELAGKKKNPDKAEFNCPQCKILMAEKEGQCPVKFIKIPSKESPNGYIVGFLADCRNCDCCGKLPIAKL